MTTVSEHSSLWLQDAPARTFPALGEDTRVDVAVVGGGIAGVTTALRLKQAGLSVAVIEAIRIGSGVTGCTTAKVSALQSTIYSTMRDQHGDDTTSVYAAACQAAVEDVAELAAGIDCDLERRPALTYAADDSELDSVRDELGACEAAGLPVEWRDEVGLPYPTAGGIWLADQLQFHPVKYLRGLADRIDGDGSHVFEQTRVTGVDGDQVRTEGGATVTADQIVIATHYPILDRGLYFARMEAQRSYCIAVRVSGLGELPMAMNAGSTTRSIRTAGDALIVGGEGHTAGDRGIDASRYEPLVEFASRHWDAGEVVGRWSAQDPVPYDKLPMIGPLVPRSTNLWVATGWQKWGLTGATFAARILTERIQGRDHEWGPTFTPTRASLRSTPEIAKLGGKFSALMAVDRALPADTSSAEDIAPGEAGVVRTGLGKTGVFRDDDGTLHGVSLRCTHLGCLLRFNGAERSWDCPCHGSRFGVDGEVLEGPAVHPLERRDV